MSDLLTVIKARHDSTKHAGYRATYENISRYYTNVSRDLVQAYVKRCLVCAIKAKKVTTHPTQAIASSHFQERGQIDLFDMQATPGGIHKNMRYVLHYQCHFTKFSILRAITTKEAENVATELLTIFQLIGPPKILQSDNGKEFIAEVILILCQRWDVTIINGRPYHPQSQGSVERANRVAKDKLRALLSCRPVGYDWTTELGDIQLQMNSERKASHKQTPYFLVFGVEPRQHAVAGMDTRSPEERAQLFEDEEDVRVCGTWRDR